MIAQQRALSGLRVMAVGGANLEHSYRIPGTFEPDKKYTAEPLPWLTGGSSVNHACRLLAMGLDVKPIVPLAASDPMSRVVTRAFDRAAETGASRYDDEQLLVAGDALTTPITTIIRQGNSRAVLNEFSAALMESFGKHVTTALERVEGGDVKPHAIAVGHVHADRRPESPDQVGFDGRLTESVLAAGRRFGARTFVNFGAAQIELGADRWEPVLREQVDVFQLDLGEARRFVRNADLDRDRKHGDGHGDGDGERKEHTSLATILEWFRSRCTVVISLERFGAVGQLRGSDRPVLAWPFLIDDVVDSTGAGDAMGAGLVASMLAVPFDLADDALELRLQKFMSALEFGRVCGAFACTTVGGADACPSLAQLAAFEASARLHPRHGEPNGLVSESDLAKIDAAFEP